MSGDECLGRFEWDFDVLDEDLGSGEFGRVLKVQRKADDDDNFGSMDAKPDNVYAIKKSKPIEGIEHRSEGDRRNKLRIQGRLLGRRLKACTILYNSFLYHRLGLASIHNVHVYFRVLNGMPLGHVTHTLSNLCCS